MKINVICSKFNLIDFGKLISMTTIKLKNLKIVGFPAYDPALKNV